jgi:hypothetical protein
VGDAQDHAGVAAGGDHFARVRHTQGEWLLTQHVLLPARGGEHGRMMQRVRQGDVDRVDARVVHQRLEVVVDALNAEALREHTSLLRRAAKAGGEPRARALDHGWGDEIGRRPAEPHDAPAYRGLCAIHVYPSPSLSRPANSRAQTRKSPTSLTNIPALGRRW